jgi:phage-related minor tail protein
MKKNSGFKLRSGNSVPFKQMGSAPVKSHISTENPWEGHFDTEDDYKDALNKIEKPETTRGRIKFDTKSGKIIPHDGSIKTTVTGGGDQSLTGKVDGKDVEFKIDPDHPSYKPTKINQTQSVISREDQDLADKYTNTLTKADVTKKKIENQISEFRKKKQTKVTDATKNLETRTTNVEDLQQDIADIEDDPRMYEGRDKELKQLRKDLSKAERKQSKAERKLERKTGKLEKYDKKVEEGKGHKGKFFTRMKSKRQEKSLRNQRNYINMSDKERHAWRQMNIKNNAELIKSFGGAEANIHHDLKTFMNPNSSKLNDYRSFTEFMDVYKRQQSEVGGTPLNKKKK